MTIRTRRKIFYTLVALFILIGGGVVYYAQGWRLDFVGWSPVSWRLEKVGAIYIRAYPEGATITLNNKPAQNQSGFLTPGTLISNLLPKIYRVTLAAPGYDAWQEDATVAPSLVTQLKYAVLVPTTSTPASSSAVAALAARQSPTSTATGIDPYNPNFRLIVAKNKLSLVNAITGTAITTSSIAGTNASITWIANSLAGVLQNNGELYLYDTNIATGGGASVGFDAQSTGPITKLADDVKSFAATSDGSTIAALESTSLEIFSLTDPAMYYRFNLPDVGAATRVIWYRDDTHLFIVYPDHVAFLDLADTSLANYITVATIANGTKPVYDARENVLYVMTAEKKWTAFAFPG